ncbi:MAG: hypothetical protein HFI09_02920 [Bacilli bacterium]|nr:hypothetical protein [Bacilli bacterium]
MKSRSEKYYDEEKKVYQSRTSRNSNLYKEINKSEINDFNIASNAKVIGENDSNSVNVDKLKEILEKNYHDIPKRREVKLVPETEEPDLELEETREYDINAILEKAREEKEVDYEKERLKKLRDTQYDILKNLNIEEEPKETKAAGDKTKEELLELINTITENELHKTKLDPLDILTDLKGEDTNTMVMGANDTTEILKGLVEENNNEKESKETKKQIVSEEKKNNKIDNSFYTNSLSFTQSDFDDFNDLKEDVESHKMLLHIIIIVITIAIIVGIIILLNSVLNLGLF